MQEGPTLLSKYQPPERDCSRRGRWSAASDRWKLSRRSIPEIRIDDNFISVPEALRVGGRWDTLKGNSAWAILMCSRYGYMPPGVEFFFALNDLVRDADSETPLLFDHRIFNRRVLGRVIRRIEKARLAVTHDSAGREWNYCYRYQIVRVDFTKDEGVRFAPEFKVPEELYVPEEYRHVCDEKCREKDHPKMRFRTA